MEKGVTEDSAEWVDYEWDFNIYPSGAYRPKVQQAVYKLPDGREVDRAEADQLYPNSIWYSVGQRLGYPASLYVLAYTSEQKSLQDAALSLLKEAVDTPLDLADNGSATKDRGKAMYALVDLWEQINGS